MFGQLMQKLDLQPPQNSGGRAPTIAMEAIPRHRAPEELGSSQESRVSIVDANIAAPMHNAGNSRPTLLQGQSHGSPLLNAEPQGILIDGVWGGQQVETEIWLPGTVDLNKISHGFTYLVASDSAASPIHQAPGNTSQNLSFTDPDQNAVSSWNDGVSAGNYAILTMLLWRRLSNRTRHF
jgi:hypothetical protein